MDPSLRIVTALPLTELWTVAGPVVARRGDFLAVDTIRHLLTVGPVQFVVAALGAPLEWVPLAECYVAWKGEVRPHLVADPTRGFDTNDYLEGYAYLASAWETEDPMGPPVVVLERHD